MTSILLNSGLTAVGTTYADALALNANADVHQISTCVAGAGVILPSSQANGRVFRIRNDGAGHMFVYAPAGGTINGMTANVGLAVPARGGEIDFVFNGPLTVMSLAVAGSERKLVIPFAVTGAVTAGMSGAEIPLSHADATIITLPAVAIGLNYKFVISAAVNNAVTISATTAVQNAILTSATTTAAECIAVVCANRTSVVFTALATAGSYYEVYSDGVKWYGKGVSGVAAGFTTVA